MKYRATELRLRAESLRMGSSARSKILLVAVSLLVVTLMSGCERYEDPTPSASAAEPRQTSEFDQYGGAGGRQFVESDQITPANVSRLKPLWSYHTGDVSTGSAQVSSRTSFEVTPILVDGAMVFCSPYNRVVSLDPLTGAERWTFDPKIDLSDRYANRLVCRGVSVWASAESGEESRCDTTIFMATNDSKLIALDANSGQLCPDFGEGGVVDTAKGRGETRYDGEYQHTSPPTVIGDKVVIGGSISDGGGTDSPSGVVRAYDARSGQLLWGQDLAPPNFDYQTGAVSEDGFALATPNVWAPMSADASLNLVFAPTGNPLPDYFRGDSLDMGFYGSSLVALNADTGEIVWNYQFVHRDFWDFDTPAQPTLFELQREGHKIPAIAQGTKMGYIFILDRKTGKPLFSVEEKPVPQNSEFPELTLSATQPIPTLPKSVAQNDLKPSEAFGLSWLDREACKKELSKLRYDGMYTPVSTDWTLMYTGNAGGINWGGLSIDEQRQLLVVNSSNLAFKVKLIPRNEFQQVRRENPEHEISEQHGTDYGMWRQAILSPLGIPCNPTPWGTLTGIDLKTGEHLWQKTLGTTKDIAPVPIGLNTGTPNFGGPLMTASGLTFIGAALDHYLRAYDSLTGEELWKGRLPAAGTATPMSYTVIDSAGVSKQLVVIAAGGHAGSPTQLSDTLVAFSLEGK